MLMNFENIVIHINSNFLKIYLHAAVSVVLLAIYRIDVSLLKTLARAHAEHIRAFFLEVAVGLEHVDQAY